MLVSVPLADGKVGIISISPTWHMSEIGLYIAQIGEHREFILSVGKEGIHRYDRMMRLPQLRVETSYIANPDWAEDEDDDDQEYELEVDRIKEEDEQEEGDVRRGRHRDLPAHAAPAPGQHQAPFLLARLRMRIRSRT
jgi:hypothetical protein